MRGSEQGLLHTLKITMTLVLGAYTRQSGSDDGNNHNIDSINK